MNIDDTVDKSRKYIFVTGGVLSGVGKGITAASVGAVLQAKGESISVQKCDPYLNVDAGLLNPAEHGECFVTRDGAETDLDLGHYERFLDIEVTQESSTLSGRLLRQLIEDERSGKFGGKTVQFVPHLTNAIQDAIEVSGKGSDVHIVEIGGTVGDYEGLSFIEAIREFSTRVGRENCLYVHLVYVPYIESSGEFKTKPAQNALKDLRAFGITPDCVVVRTDSPAPSEVGDKLAMFGGIDRSHVILLPNADTVYQVPQTIAASGVNDVLAKFTDNDKTPNLDKWSKLISVQQDVSLPVVRIGLVAKYMQNADTYLSVTEAIKAAAWSEGVQAKIVWINTELATHEDFAGVDGLVVPGGFGSRGVEGKIAAAGFAMDNNKPYLGLCLGLQAAVIAAARKAGLDKASSSEFDTDTEHNVVYLMPGQEGMESTGGTLRLGDYQAVLTEGSKVANAYQNIEVVERHRHRYEVNNQFRDDIERGGLTVSGTSPDGNLVEFVEAPGCEYFVATQAHPEFRSRPMNPHPLFSGLIKAIITKDS